MYLGMQNDLIAFVSDEIEQLENLHKNNIMNFTEIVETQQNYILSNGKYVLECSALENAKKMKHKENDDKVKAKRFNQEFTITLQDEECIFDTNDSTISDLHTAESVLNNGEDFYKWRTNNNVVINLTKNDLILIYEKIKQLTNVYNIWGHYYDLIENCTSLNDLEEIIIDYEVDFETV